MRKGLRVNEGMEDHPEPLPATGTVLCHERLCTHLYPFGMVDYESGCNTDVFCYQY
jgi:hypothetical protein